MVSYETGCLTTDVGRTCGYTFNLDPYPAKSRPRHLLMKVQADKGRKQAFSMALARLTDGAKRRARRCARRGEEGGNSARRQGTLNDL